MSTPELIIIAGPNGAGKSTTSADLLDDSGISSFDFDLEFYKSWKKFGYDPLVENGIRDSVSHLFEERKQDAISARHSFSFETNYHDKEILGTLNAFKAAGFSTELIFIILENPEIAIQRVTDRVSRGGHFVDNKTIEKRFYDGLSLLDSTFLLFDTVSIYVSRNNLISSCILLLPNKGVVEIFHTMPDSILNSVPNLNAYIVKKAG